MDFVRDISMAYNAKISTSYNNNNDIASNI